MLINNRKTAINQAVFHKYYLFVVLINYVRTFLCKISLNSTPQSYILGGYYIHAGSGNVS